MSLLKEQRPGKREASSRRRSVLFSSPLSPLFLLLGSFSRSFRLDGSLKVKVCKISGSLFLRYGCNNNALGVVGGRGGKAAYLNTLHLFIDRRFAGVCRCKKKHFPLHTEGNSQSLVKYKDACTSSNSEPVRGVL